MKRFTAPGMRKHLVFLGILLVYTLSANTLFERLFVHAGRPAETNISLPAASEAAVVKVGYMRPMRVNGEDVFELAGFAFLRTAPEVRHRIRVVLQSESGDLVFATEPPTAPAMVESSVYRDMGVGHSEFRAIISKYAIPPGNYQVGVLLDQPEKETPLSKQGAVYTLSGATLRRTPNFMRYTQPPDE